MIAKEWHDARWKLLVAAMGVVPALLIVAVYLPPYETAGRVVERFTDEMALGQILNVYGGGGVALALLAILLGTMTISEEVGRDTIFLLLSKPVSRTRVLLTKYAVAASALLMAAILGHVMLIVVAVAKGYPLDLLSWYGVVLSTVLIWLGSLLVLGLAVTFSVVFRTTLVSLAITFVTVFLVFYALPIHPVPNVPYNTVEKMTPLYSWTNVSLYSGEGFAPLNFLACFTLAAVLLLLPLWLFNRKAY